MAAKNFLGKDIDQYVIGKDSLEGCKNDKEVTTNLNTMSTELPKTSILYGETENHYSMHISDENGNVKPVYYEESKIEALQQIINADIEELNRNIKQLNNLVSQNNLASQDKDNNLQNQIDALSHQIGNGQNYATLEYVNKVSNGLTGLSTSLHKIAKSGNYNDLNNKPNIYTKEESDNKFVHGPLKTINDEPLTGTGNITITAGESTGEWNKINSISINNDYNVLITNKNANIELKKISNNGTTYDLFGPGTITIEGSNGSGGETITNYVYGVSINGETQYAYGAADVLSFNFNIPDIPDDLIQHVNELWAAAHPTTENSKIIYTRTTLEIDYKPTFNGGQGWYSRGNVQNTDHESLLWADNKDSLPSEQKGTLYRSISAHCINDWWSDFQLPVAISESNTN